MNALNDREKAFENKYANDEALRFKVIARRNKMLGLWAADKMGKTDAEADAYAKEVIIADLEMAGEEDLLAKIIGDFALTKTSINRDEIEVEAVRLLAVAKDELMQDESEDSA